MLKIKNIKTEKNVNNKLTFFSNFIKNKNLIITDTIKKNNYGFFIFIIINLIIFIFLLFYLYSVDIILLLYPDKIINYFNVNIDKDAAGLTFIGAFLPFSHYFVSLKNLYVGVFIDYKKKVYNRTVLLLKYVFIERPLYKEGNRSDFMKILLTRIPVYEKSRVYIQHKIGSFKTKDFIINYDLFNGDKIYDKNYENGGIYNYFFRYFYKFSNFRKKYNIVADNNEKIKYHRSLGPDNASDEFKYRVRNPAFSSYSTPYKSHLAYIHPYINKVANKSIDKLFCYLPEMKKYQNRVYLSGRPIQVSKLLIRPENPFPEDHWVRFPQNEKKLWYRKYPYNFFYNKRRNTNYFMFLTVPYDYSFVHPNIINKMPGLYYPLVNKQRFYEGLLKKKLVKSYIPFSFTRYPPEFTAHSFYVGKYIGKRKRSHLYMLPLMDFDTALEDYLYYNRITGSTYKAAYDMFFWNGSGQDKSLFYYLFDAHYINLQYFHQFFIRFLPIPLLGQIDQDSQSYMVPKDKYYSEKKFVYRSNVFWSLYSLYITDLFSKNKANPLFDSIEDNILTSTVPKVRRFENAQLNEFFIDFPDYDAYDARRASYYPLDFYNKLLPDVDYEMKRSISYGNFFFLGKSKYTLEDYSFFRNFFFRFKYRLEDAFYKKSLNKLGEFYIYYLELTSDKVFLNIFLFFDYIWSFFFYKLKSFFISILFFFIYYFYYHVIPLFLFLNSLDLGTPYPILIMKILGYLKLIFSYIGGTFVYYYFQKGTYFSIFHSTSFSLLILLVLKIVFFIFLLFIIMLFIEDYFNEMEDTLRLPIEVLGLALILICYAFFVSFTYFMGTFSL